MYSVAALVALRKRNYYQITALIDAVCQGAAATRRTRDAGGPVREHENPSPLGTQQINQRSNPYALV